MINLENNIPLLSKVTFLHMGEVLELNLPHCSTGDWRATFLQQLTITVKCFPITVRIATRITVTPETNISTSTSIYLELASNPRLLAFYATICTTTTKQLWRSWCSKKSKSQKMIIMFLMSRLLSINCF